MEDSVVTTRSLQWGQRILTAATDKFQKRAYRLVRYLLKLNTLFSSRHDHTEDVYNSILYRPFLNK